MNTPPDQQVLTRAGFQALREGALQEARACFITATQQDSAGANAWFGLSLTERALGAHDGELSALERTLVLAPRHVPALIRKGDLYRDQADPRAALSFYRAALKIAGGMRTPPAEWREPLDRISAFIQQNIQSLEQRLLEDLGRADLDGSSVPRFAHALDLLLGRKEIYVQQPRLFYYPELPHIQFYERRDFPWAAALEQETPAIRTELLEVLKDRGAFAPYMQPSPDRPVFNNNGLLSDPAWSACHLIRAGAEVAEMAVRCPRTLAALRKAPLCRISGRTPTALFSLLRPGAHIPPHNGYLNTRLICHLPLIVPGKCTLRVGNETRPWRAGELLIFDDSIEHEAWNRSTETRVVLLFDIWRPELTEPERSRVAATLESIDRIGGRLEEWSQ